MDDPIAVNAPSPEPVGTLHNSYRGIGVTKEQGSAYFKIMPSPIAKPILPLIEAKGIVRIQSEKRRISHKAEKRRGL